MEHRVKVTVIDKKLYPELQALYCAVPDSGKCPCFNVGDEFLFFRNDERDDYWHMGEGTLVKEGVPDEGWPAVAREQSIAGQKASPFAARRGIASAGIFTRPCKAAQSCTVGRMTTKL